MKNIKKSLRSVFCALLAAAALAAALPAHAVSQAEIDDLQKKLDALEQQAQEQQDVINDLTSQKARFITRKLALDNKIEINRQMIELIGEQIEIYDEIIAEKQAELDKALEKETAQTELLRSRIRAMEENSTYSYASFIFDSSSVTELLSRIGDVNDIMHYDKTLEEEYMAAREDVESIKKSYEEARHEQELLQKELDTKQAELDAQVEAAYTMIADIETLSDDAQAEYDAIAEEEAKAEETLQEAIRKRAAEQAKYNQNNNSNNGGGGNSGGSGGNSGGGGSSGGGSATSLSNLQWPVPSCTLITSRFGYRVAPTTGASTYHGGLDIGAGMGASIVAAGAGDVIYAGANGGYGNCVMIDHGNGVVTVYAHMSSIGVSYGQYVTAGQYVGAVGSTGVSTGPHCHFEIRINGAQTDPAAYFSGLSYWNC
ncbi:MAG: peptidoglycan DD-metalloendopeptidase family protein [Firmicutes bacterium]|nr:peptidoglycan DD-metalloendopeptidase family protein [Bacillota bacterium]